jgi:hypothetical protein
MSKSILQEDKCCCVCGTTLNLHKHHVFEGRNRKNSEEDGCWVYLCARHHNMSDEGVHFNKQLDEYLKIQMEYVWIKHYGKTIEDFIKRYRKNYLNINVGNGKTITIKKVRK